MSDLKLIDELLLDLMRAETKQPREMFHHSSVAQEAMLRLRKAWVSGEMPAITVTWANYFEEDLI